jgi:hypothetical protein
MFLHKPVRHGSLIVPLEPFRFWIRIHRDDCIWKTTPRYQWYEESPTPCNSDTGSHRIPVSMIHRVADSLHRKKNPKNLPVKISTIGKKLSSDLPVVAGIFCTKKNGDDYVLPALVIRRVDNSPHQCIWESVTPRIGDTRSRQLPVSVIQCVSDFMYRWLEESLSKYFLKNSLYHQYVELLTPRITDTESGHLPASLVREVVDSAYCWWGESLFEEKN